jgi:tetratricopeptide (TPR) repeat protein
MDRKLYKEAISSLKKAISMDPDYGEAYINLAIAYAETNDNQRAIETLESALEKSSDKDYLIYINMAQIYKRFDNKEAEKVYKKSISVNPYFQDAYFKLGEFYWDMRKYDLAAENLKKGLELQNLKSYYYNALKKGLKTYADYPDVISSLRKLDEEGPSEEIMQKYDSMVFDFYYLKNNPYIAKKYDQLGICFLRLKEYAKASESFKQSISIWDAKENRAYKNLEKANKYLQSNTSTKS